VWTRGTWQRRYKDKKNSIWWRDLRKTGGVTSHHENTVHRKVGNERRLCFGLILG